MVRSFAIVPAAGASARMGAPKLLLPWRGRSIIEHVLAAWEKSAITRTVVVARREDEGLLERCRAFDVDVVTPRDNPLDMRASVQLSLSHIANRYAPAPDDLWLLAPADLPGLSPQVIDGLLAAYDPANPGAIVPTFDGKRGHPVLLPWSCASLVGELLLEEGVNALVDRLVVRELPWADSSIVEDLDDPADYARLTGAVDCAARDRTYFPG
jgi:molybdenum cofactor cytidylyltransferase